MPWFPDFVSAAELARRQSRAEPVRQFFAALTGGDPHTLESVWPGRVVVEDPRAGEIRDHRRLRAFVLQNQAWLAGRHARIETVAATSAGGRAVVELLAHLTGPDVAWPVAVVAESPDDASVVFRTYCSQWPVDGRRHQRPPILPADAETPGDVVGRYLAARKAGDAAAAAETFAPDGYLREPVGAPDVHRGRGELSAYFGAGGTTLDPCAVTDDGVTAAVEYICVRRNGHDVPPQAGLGVFERGPDGRLAAVRIYDDVD